jgi:hypothetical protein
MARMQLVFEIPRYISYPYNNDNNLLIAYSRKWIKKPNTCSSWSKLQLGHEWFSHDYYFLADQFWIWKIFHYLITIKTTTGRKYLDTGRPGEKGQNRESPGGTGRVDRSATFTCAYTHVWKTRNWNAAAFTETPVVTHAVTLLSLLYNFLKLVELYNFIV